MAPESCFAFDQVLSKESGRIGPQLYRTSLYTSPWLDFVDQEEWPAGMGDIINQEVLERSIPATDTAWEDVTGADSCFPTMDVIDFAWNLRTYNLQQSALRSPPICLNNLRAAFSADEQINMRIQVLMDNSNIRWIERKRSEYQRLSAHKVVVASGFPESSGATFPATQPTSQLTKGTLDRFYGSLLRDGAFNKDTIRGVNEMGGYIAKVIASPETIENIVKANEDIRQDIRWSSQADELLGPWGAVKAIGNYAFVPDYTAPRYNWNGAGFTRVPYYSTEAATEGTAAEVNPNYENAQFEVSYIFHPMVYKQLNPNPNQKFGKVVYNAQNYRGEFVWDNNYDRTCNPWEDTGFWKARFMSASKAIQPRYGYAILHLRCNVPVELIDCASGSGYVS